MAAPADHSAPWASEAQFRQLIDAMPQIAWILRADGSAVEYINAQWLAYTGLSYESSLRDPNQAIHPDDQPAAAAAWAHALRYRTPYSMELRLRRSDGSYRWFLVRCAPVQDAHDTLSAWFGTSTDIHEQHEARRDTQFLAELAELIRCAEGVDELLEAAVQLAAGYFAVERCYFAEMALAEGSFQIRREFRGDLPPLAGSYRIADYPAEVVRRLGRGQMIVVDDAATDAPSSAVYAHSYAPYGLRARIVVPFLRDGAWVSNLVVASSQPRRWQARETTLLEQMAERVWLAVEKLRTAAALRANEARLQLLYAQERAARAEAEEASRLKDEFLATVSHELRTPLTALLGYIQLLQQRPRDETYVARTLEQIARSARAQAQLTEDLLDVSRIISGKLRIDPRPIDMRAVVEAALETVALAIEAKQQRLAYDVDLEFAHQRGEVHAAGRHDRRRAAARGRPRAHLRARQRGGHQRGVSAVRLRPLSPGRRHQHAPPRRARPGAGDRAPPRRAARRHAAGGQRRPWPRRGLHRVAAAPRRRGRPGAGCGILNFTDKAFSEGIWRSETMRRSSRRHRCSSTAICSPAARLARAPAPWPGSRRRSGRPTAGRRASAPRPGSA
jgi:PAS domain S-box-containing protein